MNDYFPEITFFLPSSLECMMYKEKVRLMHLEMSKNIIKNTYNACHICVMYAVASKIFKVYKEVLHIITGQCIYKAFIDL